MAIYKAVAKLGGVSLAATTATVWRFQTGTNPYSTIFEVAKSDWGTLKSKIGNPLDLVIKDSRGAETTIKEVYILHESPTSSVNRVSFVVADRRWKWAYKLIARDYNVTKKSGDMVIRNGNFFKVPETDALIDVYDFKPYSLRMGSGGPKQDLHKWTAKETVEDVLELLETREPADPKKKGSKPGSPKWKIESWPFKDDKGSGSKGQFTLQNIILRDEGGVALQRLLAYIPGAEVYVNAEGMVIVFDGSDLKAAEAFQREKLKEAMVDGDVPTKIDRSKIRPSVVNIHYSREVEVVLEYKDDYEDPTPNTPRRTEPFIECVIPTVEPETEVTVWDHDQSDFVTKTVAMGTFIEARAWLEAMQLLAEKEELQSYPWDFKTIRKFWHTGELDGALGGQGADHDEEGNVPLRIAALKQHFRQTFRINKRLVDRCRDIQAIRVGVLDTVTAQRQAAVVWGQACAIPSEKGKRVIPRTKPDDPHLLWRNIDNVGPHLTEGKQLLDCVPSPAAINITDKEMGIFRLDWLIDPYGMRESFTPGLIVHSDESARVAGKNLIDQDDFAVGGGFKIEQGADGLLLSSTLEFRVMLTVIPAAPNNLNQFHYIPVKAEDIDALFRTQYGLKGGSGPSIDILIPPGEATARFAHNEDSECKATVTKLLGLDNDDPNKAGIERPKDKKTGELAGHGLDGFLLINGEEVQSRELPQHAKSVAAETISPFADGLQGRISASSSVAGSAPEFTLKGNMSAINLRVAAAPSGKVNSIFEFPGQQRPISRMALLPDDVRRLILGIVPLNGKVR